jgi:fructokinase
LDKQGVISLGEVMVDMISEDQSNRSYQPYLGGATVNVAVGVSRHGIQSYYLCKFGKDEISRFVEEELKNEKVDLTYSFQTSLKKICKVYIQLDENGDRIFNSYINETPDVWLTKDGLNKEVFNQAKLFYFGSGTLFHDIARETTVQALSYAKKSNTLIAFDANIRLKRWKSEDICRKTINSFLKKADIVKMAEDELYFLTKTNNLDAAMDQAQNWKIPYLFITVGERGAIAIYGGSQVLVPGLNVKVVDTTGAGDAFMAAILYCFHEQGTPNGEVFLKKYLEFANQIGALSTTKMGAL